MEYERGGGAFNGNGYQLNPHAAYISRHRGRRFAEDEERQLHSIFRCHDNKVLIDKHVLSFKIHVFEASLLSLIWL